MIGASGGPYIFPAVIQVFLNHFIFKMSPLEAVQRPRVYPKVMQQRQHTFNGEDFLSNRFFFSIFAVETKHGVI